MTKKPKESYYFCMHYEGLLFYVGFVALLPWADKNKIKGRAISNIFFGMNLQAL